MAFSNKTDPAPFRNRYLNSVRYVDTLAGEAIERHARAGCSKTRCCSSPAITGRNSTTSA